MRYCASSRVPVSVSAAVTAVALAAAWTGGYVVLVLVGVPALVALVTSWRSLLARKPWEDPSIVHVNRLATHSRLSNYSSFDAAAARGESPNVVSLRYVRSMGRGLLRNSLIRKHKRGRTAVLATGAAVRMVWYWQRLVPGTWYTYVLPGIAKQYR